MKKVAAALVVLVLLGGTTAEAFGLPDPYEIALLGDILRALNTVDSWLSDIDTVLASTKRHLNDIWPESSLVEIGYIFHEATKIRSQIDRLACGWNFTARVGLLFNGLFGGLHFCKPEFQKVFGPPPTYYAQDLDEYYDYQSTLRTVEMNDWIGSAVQDESDAMWLIHEAEKARDWSDPNSPYGPGYSQRLSAVGAARLAKEIQKNLDIDREALRLEEERSDDKRYRDRKAKDLSLIALSFAAGMTPFSNEALPSGAAQ